MNSEDLLSVQRDIEAPPGGWRYTVPETGVTVTGQFFRILRDRTIAHLKANGVAVTEERLLEIEDGACRETKPPGSWCAKRPPKPVAGLPLPLLTTVETFLKCIWTALVSRQFVKREEAERRLAICKQCPLRSEAPGGCEGCYTLLRKARTLMGKNDALKIEPDEDGKLRDTCAACLCLIPLKGWMGNAALDRCEGEKKPAYWEKCWRLGN